MERRSRRGNAQRARSESAPALRRLAAFLLDQVLTAIYLAGLLGLAWGVSALGARNVVEALFAHPLHAQLLGLVLVTLPVVMYHAACEGSPLAATPGKLLLGLRVVRAEAGGDGLPLERAMLRAGLKFLPWEIAHTVLWRLPGWPGAVEALPPGAILGLTLVWILVGAWLLGLLVDPEGRTLYDRAAAARVVRTGASVETHQSSRLRGASPVRLPSRPGTGFIRDARPTMPPA